jgi:tetratricopeptide (TPR) repeat protein
MHAHADGNLIRASEKYREILSNYPHLSRVAYNLGNILKETGEYNEAERFFRQALNFEPQLFEAAQNLAFVIQEQGRIGEAIEQYQNILKRWPGLPDPQFSLACLQLLTGNLADGWHGYEARFDCLANPVPRRHLAIPPWNGVLTPGLRLLVHSEQGYGDTIQMSRYLPCLIAAGICIVLETDPTLTPLLSRIPGLAVCLMRGEALPAVDAQIPMMSLPNLLGTTLATIPSVAFPRPAAFLVQQMAAELADAEGMRVGLCWSGRMDLTVNRKRSCPPEQIRRLLDAPGCSFISLQLAVAPDKNLIDPRLIDRTAFLQDFHATAALISCLDLVITIDTAVAHLAGSLGKPTWLLLPSVPDWRWLLNRDDSPWYPSMRLFRQQQPGDWETVISRVIYELERFAPVTAGTLTNLGAKLDAEGRHVEALACYQEAMSHNPGIAVTHYNRGNTLAALGRHDEACDAWQQATILDPGLVEAFHNLGISYRDRGDLFKAHELMLHALQLRPHDADLHHTLGELFQAEDRFSEAAESFHKALELAPESARTWNSLGIVHQCLEEDLAAENCYRQALACDPDHLHARNNLGAVLLTLNRPTESVQILEVLIEQASDYHDGHWNLACSLLAAGNFERGWAEFEYRFLKHSPVEQTHTEIPRWDGSASLADKTILLTGEQAFGDSIQFVRFAPLVKACGARVILECQAPPLVPLMAAAAGIDGVVCRGAELPKVDYRLPLLSLPHALGIRIDELDRTVPYLRADQQRLSHWKRLLHDTAGLRVGLCWWGRQTQRNRRRSCPPEQLSPLANLPGITLFRLQVGDEAPAPPFPLIDHTNEIHDFADTAALISCLDLVITIDTAVAHLAGALGKPVWLMLPPTGDWRWMTDREDSPWYPSMRIFRQAAGDGWARVITGIIHSLAPIATPSVYICQQQQDFAVVAHLGNRLIPLLIDQNKLADGIDAEITTVPEQADILLFPYYLENLTEWATIEGMWRFLEKLPLFSVKEDRYLFFSDHDSPAAYHTSAWWFRSSIDTLDQDATALPPSYLTEDLVAYLHFEPDKLRYHGSFVGYLGHRKQRARLLESIAREARLNFMIEVTEAFHGHLTPEKQTERRQRYLEISSQSLCILCPSGDGTNSIRFYEALCLGRLPVLISDCPLPFEDQIPYHRFVCRISPADADRAGELLHDWLSGLGNDDVTDRCKEARRTWEAWFSPAALPGKLWAELIRKRCARMAPAQHAVASTGNRAPIGTAASFRNSMALLDAADWDHAETLITQAILQSPRSPHPYLLQGRLYARRQQVTDAERAFLQAVRYNHRYFDAYLELGRLLATAGQDHDAVERFYEAALIQPDNPVVYQEALPCLERLDRQQEMAFCHAELARISASATPPAEPAESIDTRMAAGDAYREQERWAEAFDCYHRVLLQEPRHRPALLRAGGSLIFLNRHEEAEIYLQQAIKLLPDDPDPHINLAICQLATGRWQEGWREFEWRRRYIADALPAIPELPQLALGDRLDGRTILVHCEQGFGDMLQFCRYIPLLTELGAQVIFSVPRELVRLCQSCCNEVTVIPHGALLPNADFQTLLLSLPGLLSTLQAGPLNRIPYLAPSDKLVRDWKSTIAVLPGIRVGIAWQGRNLGKSGYRRSLVLENLTPLLDLPGCSFISLHPEALLQPHPAILDCSAQISDFADTAALMLNLDLVITIDSAVAHLAGALGVTCWTALLHAPDWRWFPLHSSESIWYPTMRLFRQESPGDWTGVVKRLALSLQEELLTRTAHRLVADGQEEEALACFKTAAEHQDASAAAWLNLGNALQRAGLTEKGVKALKNAVDRDPNYPEAWQNLGLLHQALGALGDAYLCFRQALRLRPDYPTARWNLSLLQLLLGDYQAGFRNYEARFDKTPPVPRLHQELPLWDGSPLHGKRILVHAEQGYGDTIQFCRYLPILETMGAELIFEVQDTSLTSCVGSLPCQITIIARGDAVPPVDLQVPLLSLPRLLKTRPDTVPAEIPYLFADADKIIAWQQRIAPQTDLRIGLVWQGSRKHTNDRFRSCPADLLAPLAAIPGIVWYSLQPDIDDGARAPIPLVNLTASISDFSDTAALIANLDLIITVDTALAHLAGALGRPTWLLLPFAPDWRWGTTQAITPWYPAMRIFRQQMPGDWPGVLQMIADALTRY